MSRKTLSVVGALLGWFAIVTQYFLMIENRVSPIGETTVRFFTFFTILTNTLVAIYFTAQALPENRRLQFFRHPGVLTAITVYISVVGLVYQVVLRQIWEPTGLSRVVDELLHTIIPLFVLTYWYLYEDKASLGWRQLPKWLIYPAIYLIYVLIRGSFSGFYPYPFIDVTEIGLSATLVNSLGVLLLIVTLSSILIGVGRLLARNPMANVEA